MTPVTGGGHVHWKEKLLTSTTLRYQFLTHGLIPLVGMILWPIGVVATLVSAYFWGSTSVYLYVLASAITADGLYGVVVIIRDLGSDLGTVLYSVAVATTQDDSEANRIVKGYKEGLERAYNGFHPFLRLSKQGPGTPLHDMCVKLDNSSTMASVGDVRE